VAVRAAPWVLVEEVRIFVNGRLARAITEGISSPADPLGEAGLERYAGEFSLADLGVTTSDAWIIVEAGERMPAVADSDNDGLLDHADFNNDGNATEVRRPRPAESDRRFHPDAIVPGMFSWAFTNPILVDVNGNGWEPPRT
jgi:hypothetical protein